jgi:hypothetical protein
MDLNRLTNVKDDVCAVQQRTIQSEGPGEYSLRNLVPDAKKVNPLAVDNLLIYPREGYGYNNKNVNNDSCSNNSNINNSNSNLNKIIMMFNLERIGC